MAQIAEVHCTKIRFEPGDRVLVRCARPLNQQQREKIKATIQHWAGVQIEVLVFSECDYEVTIENNNDTIIRP